MSCLCLRVLSASGQPLEGRASARAQSQQRATRHPEANPVPRLTRQLRSLTWHLRGPSNHAYLIQHRCHHRPDTPLVRLNCRKRICLWHAAATDSWPRLPQEAAHAACRLISRHSDAGGYTNMHLNSHSSIMCLIQILCRQILLKSNKLEKQ